MLPSVFLLGVQKAASTSLWKDLRDNLKLAMPLEGQGEERYMRKEPQFFSKPENYDKGRGYYLSRFPKCDAVEPGTRGFDGTPNYLLGGEEVAMRMKEFYGSKAKDLHFVIIVRDRAQRMQAAFHHFMPNYGGGFDKFVEDSKGKAWAWGLGESGEGPGFIWEGSRYGMQLEAFLKHFSPNQFSIVTMEQYRNNPRSVVKYIQKRSQIPENSSAKQHEGDMLSLSRHAQHVNHIAHSEMSPNTRGTLQAYFKQFDAGFEDLVARHQMGKDTEKGKPFVIREDFNSASDVHEDLWGTYE